MTRNNTRMVEWLLLAVLFFALSLTAHNLFPGLPGPKLAQVETLSWKLGNAIVGAFLGYWADRMLVGRILRTDTDLRRMCRAVIVGAFIIGISGGI